MSIHAVHRLEAHHLGSSHATAHALDSVAAREWEGGADDEAPAGNGGDMQAQLVAELQRQGGQQGQQDQQQGRPLPHRGEEQERGEGKERNQRPPSNVVKVIGLMPFLQGKKSMMHSCGASPAVTRLGLPWLLKRCSALMPPVAFALQWTPTAAGSAALHGSPATTRCLGEWRARWAICRWGCGEE